MMPPAGVFQTIREKLSPKTPDSTLTSHIRGSLLFILSVICLGLLVFLIWGLCAPLDSAVIAQGQVIALSGKKAIQHPTVGIVSHILVKDGDVVEKGQVLIKLNRTREEGELKIVEEEMKAFLSAKKRLAAEKTGGSAGPVDAPQRDILRFRREAHKNQQGILKQRIAQQEAYRSSLAQKVQSAHIQCETLKDRLHSLEELVSQGLVSRHAMMDARLKSEDARKELAELEGRMKETGSKLKELGYELLQLDTTHKRAAAEEYQPIHIKLQELKQRQIFLSETLSRTEIRSPVQGTVTDLQHRTEGGVIAPGQRIMDIVPYDSLVIEAHVASRDIGRINAGMPVKVQLDAYKARRVPRLPGKVTYVSADALGGQAEPYYKVTVELPPGELEKVCTSVELKSGMPVTVFMTRGKRSLFQYWFDPLVDSLRKAMKEE